MTVKICPGEFDPWQEVQSYQASKPELTGVFGATCVFVGTLRDFNEGDAVKSMTLEHYPGMTEKQLHKIVETAGQNSCILDTFVAHRVGAITPQQPIVAVAVWAKHRGDAFDACRFIMEELKSKAPFWKKERLACDSERWVEKNTGGYDQCRLMR
jgi:molybdopterin synthase catalytic subunit